MSDTVAVVADVGIGGDVYRVLKEGDEMSTPSSIDHYSAIKMVDRDDVADAVLDIEERYAVSLRRVDE